MQAVKLWFSAEQAGTRNCAAMQVWRMWLAAIGSLRGKGGGGVRNMEPVGKGLIKML